MNTDVAISYKAKLIEIDNKIREIEKIGFDMSKIREELDSIKIENNNDIKDEKFILIDARPIGRESFHKLDANISYDEFLKSDNIPSKKDDW